MTTRELAEILLERGHTDSGGWNHWLYPGALNESAKDIDAHVRAAVHAERATIVKWLREQKNRQWDRAKATRGPYQSHHESLSECYAQAADAIEAGEHERRRRERA